MKRDIARHVAREVYCEVLFDLAEQMGQIELVMQDLAGVAQVMHKEPDFVSLMASTQLTGEEKVEVIRRVFRGQVSELVLDFLIVLARRDRLALLTGISQRYESLVDKHRNRVPIEVRVSRPLSDEQKEQLRTRICDAIGSDVKMSVEVDPKLIGGIVIRKGEKVVDASIRRALRRALTNVA